MCKIFTLTNMSKIKNLNKTINIISEHLASSEKDGFGYAIQGSEGVFGERSTMPDTFLTSFDKPVTSTNYAIDIYNRFGIKNKAVGAGLFHGRISTNDKTLLNTHPISADNWHLIHNGVVTNHGPQYTMNTTNDTEHLLHYLKGPGGIKDIETHLTGYYAISALDPQGQLHVFKDNIASLFVAKVESIDSVIFATTPFLIINICAELGWEYSIISQVKNNTYLIFKDNNLMYHGNISPLGFTKQETAHAERSIGRIIDVIESSEADVIEETLYSDDQISFLEEVNNFADADYRFFDYHGNVLSLEEFSILEDNEKLYCTVVRPDSTIVSSEDYDSQRLYGS